MAADDTIFALSTAPGRAGIAVIRVSGLGAQSALTEICGSMAADPPRTARRAFLRDPLSGERLDDGIVLLFIGPKSFTGEDVVEFHVHGGRAVVAGVLGVLGRLPSMRLAEPGEFTRRAFENGKLDLTEAEGLADLIDAETESQRALALRHMGGALRRAAEGWRSDIIAAQALAEAAIDFSDEADVGAQALAQARQVAHRLVHTLRSELGDQNRGEILRDGFRVVVAGRPNAGKSSLINRLAGRDAVIVSDEAGTTRDIVELHLNLEGRRVIIADTAGIREAEGKVELEGIRRGLAYARTAHLVLWVVDAMAFDFKLPSDLLEIQIPVLMVINKCDLAPTDVVRRLGFEARYISATTGDGVDVLVEDISKFAAERTEGGTGALIALARHREALHKAERGLLDFLCIDDHDAEIGAEHLRSASAALGKLTGRIDVEEVLGAIFGRFCIGK